MMRSWLGYGLDVILQNLLVAFTTFFPKSFAITFLDQQHWLSEGDDRNDHAK